MDEELTRLVVTSKDGQVQHAVSMRRIHPDGELVEPTVQIMTDHFIPRETLNMTLGLPSEPDSVESLVQLWRKKLTQGNGIAAVLVDDGTPPNTIVAANVTYVAFKNEKEFDGDAKGDAFNTVGEVLNQVMDSVDVFEKYGVGSYLSAMGLTVHPKYHGMRLGEEVLKSREHLCRILGINCSATIFSSAVSQKLASRAGFESLYSAAFTDFVVNGKQVFAPSESHKLLKLMARKYDI